MDSFQSMGDPRDMALTFWRFCATALYSVILEMQTTGFGFTPSDDKIIDYLERKRLDPDFSNHKIIETDIYSLEPWDLLGKEPVLHIFSKPNYKYKDSRRQHRRTIEGNWKITSQVFKINAVGSKRILTFYRRGKITEWVMHEFYVKDDPRYKKDFVLCRMERKRDNKHGIPPNDEGPSNQRLVSYSSKPVTENTILEAVQQPSNNSVSNGNFVTEKIFSKNPQLPCDPLNSFLRNQGEENTFLDSQQLSSDHLISSSRNHVAENSFPESHLPPNNNMISCSGNHVAENASAELQLPPNHNMISCCQLPPNLVAENSFPESHLPPNNNMISCSGNHVAENASAELQLPPNHNMITFSQLPPIHNMIAYSGNHVGENGSPGLQQLSTHSMIPHNGNHVAATGSLESQQLPNHNMISCFQLPPNLSMISYSGSHVAENASAESQLPPNHNMISCSQVPPNHNMISCSQLPPKQNMISYFGNHVNENGSLESQQLPNPNMIFYYGNHVVGNGSLEQLLPNNNMVSHYGNHVAENVSRQLLLNHNMVSHYGNHVAVNACEESQQLLLHNMISNRNHVEEIASPEAQPIANHNMISCSGNHTAGNASPESQQVLPNYNWISYVRNQIAENTLKESHLLPNQNLELLPNQHLEFYSMNKIAGNTSDAKHLPLGEWNAGSGYTGVSNTSFPALQSPMYSEQGSSYTNCSNNSGDLLNSQVGSVQVNYLINSQRAVQNESSSEETRPTKIPRFNPSEPDTGVYVEKGRDIDIDAWVNELCKN